jgi:hypothetical protein
MIIVFKSNDPHHAGRRYWIRSKSNLMGNVKGNASVQNGSSPHKAGATGSRAVLQQPCHFFHWMMTKIIDLKP